MATYMTEQKYVEDNSVDMHEVEVSDEMLQALRVEAETQRHELGQLRNVLAKVRAQEEAAHKGEEDIQRLEAEVMARREEVKRLRHALLGTELKNAAMIDLPRITSSYRGSQFRQASQSAVDVGIDNSGELGSEECIRGTWKPVRNQHAVAPPAARSGRRSWSPSGRQQGIAGKSTLMRSASTNPSISAPVEYLKSYRLTQPPWKPPGRFHADIGDFLCSETGSRSSSPDSSIRRTPPGSPNSSPTRQRFASMERRWSNKDSHKAGPAEKRAMDALKKIDPRLYKELWGSSPRAESREKAARETSAIAPPQRSAASPSPRSKGTLPQRRQTTLTPMYEMKPPQLRSSESLVSLRNASPRQQVNRQPNQWYDYPEPLNTTKRAPKCWPTVLSPSPSTSCAPPIRQSTRDDLPSARTDHGSVRLGSPQQALVRNPFLDTMSIFTAPPSSQSLSSVPAVTRQLHPSQVCSLSAPSTTSVPAFPVVGGLGTPGGFSSLSGSTGGITNQTSKASTVGLTTAIDRTQMASPRNVYERRLSAARGVAASPQLPKAPLASPRLATSLGTMVQSAPVLAPSVPILTPHAQAQFPASGVSLSFVPPAVRLVSAQTFDGPKELVARPRVDSFSAELFSLIDANSDGVISQEEFRQALHARLLSGQLPPKG